MRLDVWPRAIVLRDERVTIGNLASLFVRCLAFFVSERSPAALRRRAAITLASLDLPTVRAWMMREFESSERLRDASTLALAVLELRGTSDVFRGGEGAGDATAAVVRHAHALVARGDRHAEILAGALRHSLARAFAAGELPSWWQSGDALSDKSFTALMATLAPAAMQNEVEARLLRLDPARDAEVFAHLALCARRVRAPLPEALVEKLGAVCTRSSTNAKTLDACLRLLDRRAAWQPPESPFPSKLATWDGQLGRARAWARSFARRDRPRAVLEALVSAESPGPAACVLIEEGLGRSLSAALWKSCEARVRSRVVHDLLTCAIRSTDPGSAVPWPVVFDRLHARINADGVGPSARVFGRAFARCLLGIEGSYREKNDATWMIDLLEKDALLEAFGACYRAFFAVRPLIARDLVFALPRTNTVMRRSVRMRIPAMLDAMTRERARGLRLLDPADPLRG